MIFDKNKGRNILNLNFNKDFYKKNAKFYFIDLRVIIRLSKQRVKRPQF